ncbi:MAG TPA: site-2 protease family protein, partial [Planctomycetaceae bacterium]|nr:site-2 protease family protein [Planctomycetaceae bacterium]
NEEIAADPRSYVAKNVLQRMAIISAGVTMNVITAVLFYIIAFGFGVDSVPPVIGVVSPGLPAWQAGVRRGDVVEKLNGRSVASFQDLALHVAVSDGDIALEGKRKDGTPFKTVVTPDFSGTRPQIGIRPSPGLTVVEAPKTVKPTDTPVQPESAASRANPAFEWGDQLVKVGETEVTSFAQFQDVLATRNGAATTVTVKRKGAPLEIAVDSNYFRTLGLRFDAAPITAIQTGSPAAAAGLEIGDKFAKINGKNIGAEIDPLRLPDEFAQLAGQSVDVVVSRQNPKGGRMDVQLKVIPDARPGWLDPPEGEGEPISIPAIGVAFHTIPVILHVEPDGPAAQAGIPVQAKIQSVEFVKPDEAVTDKAQPKIVALHDEKNSEKANNWGYIFAALQRMPGYHLKLTIRENDQTPPRVVTVVPAEDKTWPSPQLGLMMQVTLQQEKAANVSEAISMGANRAWSTVLNIYLTLKSLVTGRLSHKELHGPLGIAQAAYESARMGFVPFLLFLGFLSLNLAVLNFLPIPVLDGGHMVFLLYEGLTGKRPSEKIMVGSLYVGLAFLLGLMALVLYLDIGRLFTTPK